MQKRIAASLIVSALILFSSAIIISAASTAPSRMINVVYDDSGSMIGPDNDTWCQAKYAMEVFAAMLGIKDKMNIYVMSDFENGTGAKPKLMLSGSNGSSANVASVHNMITRAGNTPFDTVRKAYSDLTKASADEKWLVVLTDGEFQGVDSVDSFFANKAADVRVMFLGMGPNAEAVKSDAARSIFFEKAETSTQILSKITGICTRIFNSD